MVPDKYKYKYEYKDKDKDSNENKDKDKDKDEGVLRCWIEEIEERRLVTEGPTWSPTPPTFLDISALCQRAPNAIGKSIKKKNIENTTTNAKKRQRQPLPLSPLLNFPRYISSTNGHTKCHRKINEKSMPKLAYCVFVI